MADKPRDCAAEVYAARANVEQVMRAYARGRASCEQVNAANEELAQAQYALSNPGAPVCVGREK